MIDTPLPLEDMALDEIPNGQQLYELVRTQSLVVLRERYDIPETQAHNIASRIAEKVLRERNRSRIEKLKRHQARVERNRR